MRYFNLSALDAETKAAVAVVDEVLRDNTLPHYTRKIIPWFRIDNLAFLEVMTTPPPELKDAGGSSAYVAVILGDEPRLFHMPNEDLFAQFASAIRAEPGQMELRERLLPALILATGNGSYIHTDDRDEPTWTDEDGVLVIRIYRYARQGSPMMRPRIESCTITVDESQRYTIERVIVGFNIP